MTSKVKSYSIEAKHVHGLLDDVSDYDYCTGSLLKYEYLKRPGTISLGTFEPSTEPHEFDLVILCII